MLRCLKGPENTNWDTVIGESLEIELIKREEADGINENDDLTLEQLKIFLYRMLQMPRGCYMTKESFTSHRGGIELDLEKSKTYLEWYTKAKEFYKAYYTEYYRALEKELYGE